jgi:fibrillarin-like pre-rRNA processing protein
LIDLAKKRKNIAPVLADARRPREYTWCEEVDVVYCDVADPQETELAMRNADLFLKENGCLMIAVKSQSIDVTKKSKDVYEEEKKKLENNGFRVVELIDLEPLEKNHAMVIAEK